MFCFELSILLGRALVSYSGGLQFGTSGWLSWQFFPVFSLVIPGMHRDTFIVGPVRFQPRFVQPYHGGIHR